MGRRDETQEGTSLPQLLGRWPLLRAVRYLGLMGYQSGEHEHSQLIASLMRIE
jgi:hypothetical protein